MRAKLKQNGTFSRVAAFYSVRACPWSLLQCRGLWAEAWLGQWVTRVGG